MAGTRKADEGFSPAQLGALTGAPAKQVNKVVDERLPRSLVWSVKGAPRRRLISPAGAVCFAIDARLPREVPLVVRKAIYAEIAKARTKRLGELGKLGCLRVERGPMLSYAVDVKRAVDEVSCALERYR